MVASHTVEHAGRLLDFLFECRPEMKRTRVRQWLRYGSIHVNGRSVTRDNHPLDTGDVVSIHAKSEVRREALLPVGMRILFEDASLLVIDKPENLLSVASAKKGDRTAYAFLTDYVRGGSTQSSARVWIVHRLDRDTSGLMVFAKTKAAKRVLQEHWDETDKRYLAVVEGSPPANRGIITSYLDESNPFKVHSTPPSERTRHAVTHYQVVKRVTTCALVELTPKTGRRNQLRVHLADVRCPIVGDRKYDARTNPVRRLGLHATSLQFKHPSSGALLRFESPLPKELARLV